MAIVRGPVRWPVKRRVAWKVNGAGDEPLQVLRYENKLTRADGRQAYESGGVTSRDGR